MSRSRLKARRELIKDIGYICIGIFLAIVAVQGGAVDLIISLLGGSTIASFVAGIFFTSAFTLAPAAVALAHISLDVPLAQVAFWGGLGAMCGDLLLFLFIRDKFAKDLQGAFRPSFAHHVVNSFHLGFMKWLSPLIGAAIIASPLPDEFGLALMGLSRTRIIVLMPISFAMNVIGIYIVAAFAHFL
jgi:hypothetical protein